MPDETELATVTCVTDGCENYGIAIEVPAGGIVFCGPCGAQLDRQVPA